MLRSILAFSFMRTGRRVPIDHSKRYSPFVEELCARIVPATDFVGGINNNYIVPGNWNPAAVPTVADEVTMTNRTVELTFGNREAASLTMDSSIFDISNNADLNVLGFGTVAVTDGSELSVFGGGLLQAATRIDFSGGSVGFLGAGQFIAPNIYVDADSEIRLADTSATIQGNLASSGLLFSNTNGGNPTIIGDYTPAAGSETRIRIFGADVSTLTVTGTATLDGAVSVAFVPNIARAINRNDVFDALTYGARAGAFANANVAIGPFVFDVQFNNTVKAVQFVPPPMGIANGINQQLRAGHALAANTEIGEFDDAKAPGLTAGDYTVTINWGDGASGAGVLVGSAGAYTVEAVTGHTYFAVGIFNASFTIEDNGSGLTEVGYFTVDNAPPIAYEVVGYTDNPGIVVWDGMVIQREHYSTSYGALYRFNYWTTQYYDVSGSAYTHDIHWDPSAERMRFGGQEPSWILEYGGVFDGVDWDSDIDLDIDVSTWAYWVGGYDLTITLRPIWS